MYSIGDNIRLIDRLGHSYTVQARYYCQSDNSQATWLLHASDILPVFNYCLVNCDSAILEHLVITHADDDGIIPNEATVNSIMLDDCLMPLKLIVCHPKTVKDNYPFWNDLIMGNWQGETLVTLKDGILYICYEMVA
jgi:hypothetical protein